MAWGLVLCSSSIRISRRVRPPAPPPLLHSDCFQSPRARPTPAAKEREDRNGLMVRGRNRDLRSGRLLGCQARKQSGMAEEQQQGTEDGRSLRQIQQAALWAAEAAYVIWLFLLPYAPVRVFLKLLVGKILLLSTVRSQHIAAQVFNLQTANNILLFSIDFDIVNAKCLHSCRNTSDSLFFRREI